MGHSCIDDGRPTRWAPWVNADEDPDAQESGQRFLKQHCIGSRVKFLRPFHGICGIYSLLQLSRNLTIDALGNSAQARQRIGPHCSRERRMRAERVAERIWETCKRQPVPRPTSAAIEYTKQCSEEQEEAQAALNLFSIHGLLYCYLRSSNDMKTRCIGEEEVAWQNHVHKHVLVADIIIGPN